MFNGIKKSVIINIIKTLVNYDDEKDEFLRELEGFITDLHSLLDSISEIKELNYTIEFVIASTGWNDRCIWINTASIGLVYIIQLSWEN